VPQSTELADVQRIPPPALPADIPTPAAIVDLNICRRVIGEGLCFALWITFAPLATRASHDVGRTS